MLRQLVWFGLVLLILIFVFGLTVGLDVLFELVSGDVYSVDLLFFDGGDLLRFE